MRRKTATALPATATRLRRGPGRGARFLYMLMRRNSPALFIPQCSALPVMLIWQAKNSHTMKTLLRLIAVPATLRNRNSTRSHCTGKQFAEGDPLAPHCKDCHGNHDILPAKDARSPVSPLKVPFLCGKCHQEGAPVAKQRVIHQDHILENFSESIHGEGLLKKGLIVAPNCASCHTPHSILPHTDPASSIARKNIAATCTKCHAQIEAVHRKVIKGELWEKQSHMLPACIDCHQPHKIRKVFYTQGMADKDCMRCHENKTMSHASKDGRSLFVRADDLSHSKHSKTACSQCHSEVNASHVRPCETITKKVDCCFMPCRNRPAVSGEHARQACREERSQRTDMQGMSRHARGEGKARTGVADICNKHSRDCVRNAIVKDKRQRCGIPGTQHEIIEHYTESIHGKGLMKSGLTVTATCTNCHTAHSVLPKTDSLSSVNPKNVPCNVWTMSSRDRGTIREEYPLRQSRTDRQATSRLQ